MSHPTAQQYPRRYNWPAQLSLAESLGAPLSPAELDFAARRMPVCTCPRLVNLSGPDRVHHRPACTYAAIGGAQ